MTTLEWPVFKICEEPSTLHVESIKQQKDLPILLSDIANY